MYDEELADVGIPLFFDNLRQELVKEGLPTDGKEFVERSAKIWRNVEQQLCYSSFLEIHINLWSWVADHRPKTRKKLLEREINRSYRRWERGGRG